MAYKFYMFTLFVIISSVIPAQEIIKAGTHQQHKEEFGFSKKSASVFNVEETEIIPLQTIRTKSLSKIVFGFLPFWEYANGAHNNIQYDLLTHIAVFDFQVSATGTLTNPSGWPWTDVINAAHAKGTKVIMTVTNFNTVEIHTLLTNNTSKNTLFDAIKNTISNYQLDGVNIDFEGLGISDRGDVLNTFMADLTSYIHTNLPGKEVSFDAPAVNWGGWNMNNLVQSVDYLIIMGYDYNGSWSTTTGAVAPLTHPSGGISVSKSLNNDYSVPIANYPEKLVLAVPYYGKHWQTSTGSAGSPIISYVESTFYKNTAVASALYGGYIWDTNSQTPWYKWQAGGWNQVWADNEQSLGLKYDLALTKNLGGIGIWALNYDGNRSELWSLIELKFNNPLAVDDSSIKQHIKIYPNPANDYFNISNSEFIKITSIEIYNLHGQKIKSYNPERKTIDVNGLKSAVYFLRIRDENNNTANYKIIKS